MRYGGAPGLMGIKQRDEKDRGQDEERDRRRVAPGADRDRDEYAHRQGGVEQNERDIEGRVVREAHSQHEQEVSI